MSIEILSVGRDNLFVDRHCNGLGIDTSFPPISDREPSIWQSEISKMGGTLVHIYDEDFNNSHRRWAYNIIDEQDWKRFRFKPEIIDCVWSILGDTLYGSPLRRSCVYIDAQWSNTPKKFLREYSLRSFRSYHDRLGIRMNSAFVIRG